MVFNAKAAVFSSPAGAGDDYVTGSIGTAMNGGSGTDLVELDLSSLTTAISLKLANQVSSAVQLGSNTSIQGFEAFLLTTGSGADTLDLRDFRLLSYEIGSGEVIDSDFGLSDGTDTVLISSTTRGRAVVYDADILNVDFSASSQATSIWGGRVWAFEGDLQIDFFGLEFGSIRAIGGSGDDNFAGGFGNDTLSGGAGDDWVDGSDGKDILTGGAGNDKIIGGDGDDLVVYSGLRSNFIITKDMWGTVTVRDLRSGSLNLGVDTLSDIEKIKFDDGQFALKSVITDLPPENIRLGYSEISEWTWAGDVVTYLTADDPEGGQVTFSLASDPAGKFKLVGNELVLKSRLDYETAKTHTITVIATDAAGNKVSKNLTIKVTDWDEAPVISSNSGGSTASISIEENKKSVTRVVAKDPEGKAVTYEISGGADAGLFTIDAKTGLLSFKSAPNHEKPQDMRKNNVYDVTVGAIDSSGWWSTQEIRVTVKNVDEAPTAITLSKATVAENTKVGTTVGVFSAFDPEGKALTYTLADNTGGLFKLAGNKLIVAKAIDYEKLQSDTITVRVKDTGGVTANKTFTIKVADLVETINAPSSGGLTKGGSGADRLKGGIGKDTLEGGAGNDILKGEAANDKLYGGLGADHLYGGAGKDIFLFKALSDTTVATSGRDTIFDFSGESGDRIDLSGIDANTKTTANEAFSLIGRKDFSGKAGELRYEWKSSDTYLYGDTDGDRKADFAVHFDDTVALREWYFSL